MERSSSGRSSFSSRSTPLMPGRVVIAYDATKNNSIQVFKDTITNIKKRDGMIEEGDIITVLGVLHKILHPMGFQMQLSHHSVVRTHVRAIEEEVSRKLDAYLSMLQHIAAEYEGIGVDIEVKIVVGTPMKNVVVQEVAASNATWVVLDRHLRKEMRFYLKHIPCKVAQVLENLSLEVLRPYNSDKASDISNHKLLFAISKPVLLSPAEDNETNEQSSNSSVCSDTFNENSDIHKSISVSSLAYNSKEHSTLKPVQYGSTVVKEKPGINGKPKKVFDYSPPVMQEHHSRAYFNVPGLGRDREMKAYPDLMEWHEIETDIVIDVLSPENALEKGSDSEEENERTDSALVACTSGKMETELDPMKYSYYEIQTATNNFASENLLGEGVYGVVYRGQLRNGQLITAKVQKKSCFQGISQPLRFACHKNIEMLLGYCCNENLYISVYEFICNKSLEWHLFGNTEHVLDWHHRHAISIGISKGLRFLHEECRGGPIMHRDLTPSNVLLTHDFVPLLGNFDIANWKICDDDKETAHATPACLAPECAENGTFSVRADVYAFGIILIQLISGRKFETVESAESSHHQSLTQWALPLIEMLALDQLVDPRLGDLYNMYELYNMARAAYLCLQNNPNTQPSMGEVLLLLEGTNDHLRYLSGRIKRKTVSKQTACEVVAIHR